MLSVTALILALGLLSGPPVHGKTRAPAAVRLLQCTDIGADEIERLLRIELAPLLAARRPGGGLTITLRCSQDSLHVRLDVGARVYRRTLRRGEYPAREGARLVALVAAELVAESQRVGGGPPTSKPVVAVRPSVSVAKETVSPAQETAAPGNGRWRLHAMALAGALGDPLTPVVGGAIAVNHRWRRLFGWRADLAVTGGSRSTALGRVGLVSLSGSLAAALRLAHRWASGAIAIGGRWGAVRLGGRPDDARTAEGTAFWEPWLGPMVLGEVALDFGRRVTLLLGVEGGYVLRPVRGLVQEDGTGPASGFGLDGFWVLASFGAGIRL